MLERKFLINGVNRSLGTESNKGQYWIEAKWVYRYLLTNEKDITFSKLSSSLHPALCMLSRFVIPTVSRLVNQYANSMIRTYNLSNNCFHELFFSLCTSLTDCILHFLLVLFQGGEVMFITYSDDFPLPDHGDFYVVFEGKKQRHVTTAQQLNTYTLRAVVPGKQVIIM